MAFEGWDVPGFTRNKHRDLMMQFRSNTKLEKELGSRTGFRKKYMRNRSSWYLGTGESWCHSSEGEGKGERWRGKSKENESIRLMCSPGPLRLNSACLFSDGGSSFSQSTYLNVSPFQTRYICIQKGWFSNC